MKKMISFKIDPDLLKEFDKTIIKVSKQQKRKLTRTQAIEDAIIDWINMKKLDKTKLKQIGVDEDGMPIYRIQ